MKRNIIYFFVIIFSYSGMCAVTIGSDTTVSLQTRSFFKKGENSTNLMKGFSVFWQGFILENANTTVSFNAFFPVSGDIVLNGGTLSLLNDIEFRNPFRIGVGTIAGNGYALEIPRTLSYLDFPSPYYIKLIIHLLASYNTTKEIMSIDWSFDNRYLAVGSRGQLQIYFFDGMQLSLVASQNFGLATVYAVRWKPNSTYLATGASSNPELQLWYFNTNTNSLTQTDSKHIDTIYALEWNPDGTRLAVGLKRTNTLSLYPVTNGLFGSVVTGSFGTTVDFSINGISWHESGSFIGVGASGGGNDLFIFSVGVANMLLRSSLAVSGKVNALSWLPHMNMLAVGLQASTECLRMYSFNTSSYAISEIETARVGVSDNVLGMQWSLDGMYLGVVKEYAFQNFETDVYFFDSDSQTLHLVTGYSSDLSTRGIRWSSNNAYLATGDSSGNILVFDFNTAPFVFKNLKLFLRSELRAHASIIFQGDCAIYGDGNILDLDETATLKVAPNSSLILEDVVIKGINENIQCSDNSSQIIFRDTKLGLDGNLTFSIGSFKIVNDVTINGDGMFLYESVFSSTIDTKSQIILDAGVTYSFDPPVPRETLFYSVDKSATINLNGATIAAGRMGFSFLDGTLLVSRDSYLVSDVDSAITIGNQNALRDCYVDILTGVYLQINKGTLNYKNVASESWNSRSYSTLFMAPHTKLMLYTSLNIGNGMFYFDEGVYIYRYAGGNLIGRINSLGQFTFEYES